MLAQISNLLYHEKPETLLAICVFVTSKFTLPDSE